MCVTDHSDRNDRLAGDGVGAGFTPSGTQPGCGPRGIKFCRGGGRNYGKLDDKSAGGKRDVRGVVELEQSVSFGAEHFKNQTFVPPGFFRLFTGASVFVWWAEHSWALYRRVAAAGLCVCVFVCV